MVLCDFVNVPAAGEFFHRPQSLVPSSAQDPLVGRGVLYARPNPLAKLGQRFHSRPINRQPLETRVGQVHMGIVEAGHHEMPAQVDHFSGRSLQLHDLVVPADGFNSSIAHRHGFRALDSMKRRGVYAGIDVRVEKNDVGPGLRGQALRRSCRDHRKRSHHYRAHGPEESIRGQLHKATPARPIRVSRMRLRPSSRPLQSNHSCKVCAPPPVPPPPMAMASSPSDSGILASVDARCTCAALPSCASTARTTCRMRAFGYSSPAGRFPMTTTSELSPKGRRRDAVPCFRGSRFLFHGLTNRMPQSTLQAFHLRHRRGTDVHPHAGRFRNRIHRSPAANDSDVEGGLGRCRHRSLCESLHCTRQHHDGIGRAEIAPGVSAGAAHDHFEAAAAQGLGHDGVRARAVEHQAVVDLVLPSRLGKNVAHAAQVAFPFFAHVAYK